MCEPITAMPALVLPEGITSDDVVALSVLARLRAARAQAEAGTSKAKRHRENVLEEVFVQALILAEALSAVSRADDLHHQEHGTPLPGLSDPVRTIARHAMDRAGHLDRLVSAYLYPSPQPHRPQYETVRTMSVLVRPEGDGWECCRSDDHEGALWRRRVSAKEGAAHG